MAASRAWPLGRKECYWGSKTRLRSDPRPKRSKILEVFQPEKLLENVICNKVKAKTAQVARFKPFCLCYLTSRAQICAFHKSMGDHRCDGIGAPKSHTYRNNQETSSFQQPFFQLYTAYSSLFLEKTISSAQLWPSPSSLHVYRPLFSFLFLVIKSAGITVQIKSQYPHYKCKSLALSSLTREWAGKAKSLSQAFKIFLIPLSLILPHPLAR